MTAQTQQTPKTENKLTYGIENVRWATITVAQNGNITYGKPKPLPGAQELELDPQGQDIKLKADNIDYYVSETNEGYTGKLKAFNLTDEFRQYALGETVKGDLIVESADSKRQPFALLFQFEGDQYATRHVLFNCSAKRPKEGSKTKDGANYNEIELEFTASPRATDKIVKAKTHKDTNSEKYEKFFDDVIAIA